MITKKVGLRSANCKETLQQERIYLNAFQCSAICKINITFRPKTNQHFSLFQDKMANSAVCKIVQVVKYIRKRSEKLTSFSGVSVIRERYWRLLNDVSFPIASECILRSALFYRRHYNFTGRRNWS